MLLIPFGDVAAARYPATLDEFYRARLPGSFDDRKAGRRMKLPVAETWETQVALKGNKASTWMELIGSYNVRSYDCSCVSVWVVLLFAC